MVTRYEQFISKISPALPLLVISTFVSSVGADDQRPDFQQGTSKKCRNVGFMANSQILTRVKRQGD